MISLPVVKKFIVILLLSVYSVSTLGLSLKSFYCCGNLESVTLSISQDEHKQCSDGDDTSDCCKTKYQFFKVKDSHVNADLVNAPDLHFIDLHFISSSFQDVNYPSQEIHVAHLSNGPPLNYSVLDYIFNCVFRI